MDKETFAIRRAQHGDLSGLVTLYRHLDPEDEPPAPGRAAEIFERFLAYEGSAILLGEVGTTPVASLTLVVIPNLTRGGSPYALVENVVTHAGFRKRGFGRRMLDAATETAWQAGCYKVMLMTGSRRPETLGFYLGAGFEQTKTGFQKRHRPVRAET